MDARAGPLAAHALREVCGRGPAGRHRPARTGGRGVLFKAYLRAVTNSAIGLGAVFGGLALVVDARWAYLAVFVLNAVFTALAAWNSTRLPDLPAYGEASESHGSPCCATCRSS